jgi:hypothetical protein
MIGSFVLCEFLVSYPKLKNDAMAFSFGFVPVGYDDGVVQ